MQGRAKQGGAHRKIGWTRLHPPLFELKRFRKKASIASSA
jgi:hypothetical protein